MILNFSRAPRKDLSESARRPEQKNAKAESNNAKLEPGYSYQGAQVNVHEQSISAKSASQALPAEPPEQKKAKTESNNSKPEPGYTDQGAQVNVHGIEAWERYRE